MFQISGSAFNKLNDIMLSEKKDQEEKLFIRLSMGIG
jgi:hypothetical protein